MWLLGMLSQHYAFKMGKLCRCSSIAAGTSIRPKAMYAPPFTRRHPHPLPKHAREMGLIAHPAIQGNLTKGMAARQHHLLSALDAQSCDIGEWGLAERFLESSKEVPGT